jgi:sugar lactone lactonase YvrE
LIRDQRLESVAPDLEEERMRKSLAVGGFVVSGFVVPGATADAEELYVSLPSLSEIRRFDTSTGLLEPWVDNVGVPSYGEWGPDDRLYISDSSRALVWGIDPDGTKRVVSSGGLLSFPLSVCIHPTTGELFVTDFGFQHIVAIDPATGSQRVFCDNALGLFVVPGGIHFDPAGNLWMTDHGNHDIVVIDPSGHPVEFVDGPSNGLEVPAGIEVDRSGNAFVATYEKNKLVRIRTDTGEVIDYCTDHNLKAPNDMAFGEDGSVYTTTSWSSALIKVDVTGAATVLYQDYALGDFLGVAPRRTAPHDGTMTLYGSGTAGSGGHVPRLRGILTPDLGTMCAFEVDFALGGAGGYLIGGLAAGSQPKWGGTVLVSLTDHFDLYPVTHAGSGAGNGSLFVEIEIPGDDPALAGLPTYWQDLVFDKGAPKKIAMSNGLEMVIGQ